MVRDRIAIGFLVSSIDGNPVEKIDVPKGIDLLVFRQNLTRSPWNSVFSSFAITESYGFGGVAIATTLDTAKSLLGFPGPMLKYFMPFDMDWGDGTHLFEETRAVFADSRMPVLVRTNEEKRIVEDCWNVRVRAVIEDCNLVILRQIIREDLKGKNG